MASPAATLETLRQRPELAGTFPHHPDCPACWADRKYADCVRHIRGLRAARVSDDTIRMTLVNGWYPDWLVDEALTDHPSDQPVIVPHPA